MTIYQELSFENDVKQIEGIQFSIMTAEEIEKKSVAEIVSTDTYSGSEPIIGGLFDSRMGVIENERICKICHQKNAFCPGHFGHIKLAKPIFHMQFFDVVRKILKCVCFRCSSLLADPNDDDICKLVGKKISRQKRFDFIYKGFNSSKIKRCGAPNGNPNGCGAKQANKITKENIGRIIMEFKDDKDKDDSSIDKVVLLAEDVLNIFKRISDEDAAILGFTKQSIRPEALICQVFPVPPPSVRPSVRNDTGQRCEDDLTHKLCDIIKTNNTLKQKLSTNQKKEVIDYWVNLVQYHISTFVDNQIPGVPPAKQRTGRPLRSVTERLKSKEGRIRGNLMGKRVDFSARSVITPDPNISIDEVGVPIKVAMNLTFPETVHEFNQQKLNELIHNGPLIYPGAKYIKKKSLKYRTIRISSSNSHKLSIEKGDIVERHLLNGDYVLFNRQPSLHKMSMMSHRVRVMNYDTFRLNVCCTPSYNADYDGDEMNLHVPQSLQTENELIMLASVPTQIISPKDSSPIISIVQDITLGIYKITHPSVSLSEKQVMNLIANNTKFHGGNFPKTSNGIFTGRNVLSTVFPPTLNTKIQINDDEMAIVKDGQITDNSGVFTKDAYQKMSNGIIHSTYNDMGIEETKALFDNTQRLICDWLVLHGFSVGVSDLMITDKTKSKIQMALVEMENNCAELETEMFSNKVESKYMMTNEEYVETEMQKRLRMKDVEALIQKDPNVKNKDNRMMNMIKSKSKGNPVNVLQMMGAVGQVNVEGKRISYGFDDRTLPHYQKYNDGPEARGFVKHSFIDGLNPQEFYFHAMGGREGLIDTAVKSVTGDTDIIVLENGVIRDVKIGDWIDNFMEAHHMDIEYNEKRPDFEFLDIKDKCQVFIPTGDSKGNNSWGLLTAVTRHDPTDVVYEIKTSGGRTVTVADSESLLIWDQTKGQFLKKHSSLVNEGDFTPVCMNLPAPPTIITSIDMSNYFPKEQYVHGTEFWKCVELMREAQGDKYFIPKGWYEENNGKTFTIPYTCKARVQRTTVRSNTENIRKGCIYPYHAKREGSHMPDKFDLDYNNGVFIGLYLADGCFHEQSGTILISKEDESVQNFVKEWFDRYNITHRVDRCQKKRGISTSIIGSSTLFARFFKSLVGHGSRNKHVPDVAYQAPLEFVRGIISGYFSGDGTINGDLNKNGKIKAAGIECCSVSKPLIEGIQLLLNRFGIFGKVRKSQQKSNNVGTIDIAPLYTMRIRAQWGSKFAREIELIHEKKQLKLQNVSFAMQHRNFDSVQDSVMDEIVSITKKSGFEVCDKMYDVTVPSTLNFMSRGGINLQDTSETGYLQRKLVKAMEDAKVNFDLSVKNAGGQIIQFLYGDDGMDSCKLEKQHLPYLGKDMDISKLTEMFLIDTVYKLKDHLNDELMKLLRKHDTRAKVNKMLFDYFEKIIDDRRFVISDILKYADDRFIYYPVAFQRIINTAICMFGLENNESKSDLSPEYILNRSEELQRSLILGKFIDSTNVMRILLRCFLNPKRLIIEYKFTKAAFDYICEKISVQFHQAIVNPSEMVGVVAAQSIGEPTTQLTLNTFHLSGVASASKAVRGVPRIKELLSISKNIKSPSLKIFLNDKFTFDVHGAAQVQSMLQTVHFSELMHKIEIYYEGDKVIEDDQEMINAYKCFSLIQDPEEDFSIHDDVFQECEDPPEKVNKKWLIRIELDKEKMANHQITTEDVYKILTINYNNKLDCKHSDDNARHIVFRIKLSPDSPEDIITDLKAMEQELLSIIISGVQGINDVSIDKRVPSMHIDDRSQKLQAKQHENDKPITDAYMLVTDGTNLKDILGMHKFVDPTLTISNDIYEIYEVLGIEAARQALFNEIDDIFKESGNVNQRHISLLVDTMTSKGTLLSIDRHGINRSDIGPLAKCSFEETADILIKSGVFGEYDKMQGVAANIIVGQIPKAGTGDSDIIMDHDIISKCSSHIDDGDSHIDDMDICLNGGIDFDQDAIDCDVDEFEDILKLDTKLKIT